MKAICTESWEGKKANHQKWCNPSFFFVCLSGVLSFFLRSKQRFIPSTGCLHLSRRRPLWTEPEGLICLTLWRGCWQKLRIKAWWHHAFLQRTDETRCPGGWLVWPPWGMRWDVGNKGISGENGDVFFGWMRTKLKIVPRVIIHGDDLSQVH